MYVCMFVCLFEYFIHCLVGASASVHVQQGGYKDDDNADVVDCCDGSGDVDDDDDDDDDDGETGCFIFLAGFSCDLAAELAKLSPPLRPLPLLLNAHPLDTSALYKEGDVT